MIEAKQKEINKTASLLSAQIKRKDYSTAKCFVYILETKVKELEKLLKDAGY